MIYIKKKHTVYNIRLYNFVTGKLPELDKKAQIAEDDAQNVINELTVQLENHGVVFDKLIECQRIYYESEKGITLFTEIIDYMKGNLDYTSSKLKENHTELIDCFQGQIKQYEKERDSRVDFACYNNIPLELYQSTIFLNTKLGDLYHCKAEFSKHLFFSKFSWDIARKIKQQMKN
ncbi:unnamed protein product [Schistosoma margrebowiei]|uniref:Uncharacterized protein n=1 Tax=Schistosoma margrebowiei TaxID=48269 RepID=A0AA85A102_9TREM|nr:unnamed protein product [Schistosoma margrebowiei]